MHNFLSQWLQKSPRFLRNSLIVVCVVGLFFCGAGFFLLKRLSDIACWAFAKAVPGAVLELQGFRVASLHHLVVEGLVVRNKKSQEELVKMKGGTATFSFRGLLNLQVAEIRLVQPVFVISPQLLELFSASPRSAQTKSTRGGSFPLEFTRIVCEEGDLRMVGLGEKVPECKAKLSFDLRDLNFRASKKNHHIILWAVSAKSSTAPSPFLQLDRMEVIFNMSDLQTSRLDRIRVQGGKLVVGKELRALVEDSKTAAAMQGAGSGGPSALSSSLVQQSLPSPPLPAWRVDHMNILGVQIALEEEKAGVMPTQLQFQLTTRLKNITLGDAASNVGSVLQTVQLSNIALSAPSGGKVVDLPHIFIRFTLEDLLQKRIEEVVILYPKIYLNEDLFAYIDSISGLTPTRKPGSSSSSWSIRRLRVDFGGLIIGANDQNGVGLPIEFETNMHDIALENLAELRIDAQLRIPEENYEFASYQLEFKSKSGEMHFFYPPAQGANNVVALLKLAHLRWKQYLFQEPWIAVTFDRKGINGKFGAQSYSGYVSGGFSFFFGSKSPWSAWLDGRKVDLSRLTKMISPENFTMTGPLNLSLQLKANGPSIAEVKGSFRVEDSGGKFHIGKMESLLKDLPPEWSALKRSAATIALETLQDFEYQKALGDFSFVNSEGTFNLNLFGPAGSRKLKFVVHPPLPPSSSTPAITTTVP